MTLTFNPRRAVVMTYIHTKTHVQRRVGSKDRVETNGRTNGRTLAITLAFRLTLSVTITWRCRLDRAAQHKLDVDSRNKQHAQMIDERMHRLNSQSIELAYHDGIEYKDDTWVPNNTFRDYSQLIIRWLYCVECPQYTIRLEVLGYLCTSCLPPASSIVIGCLRLSDVNIICRVVDPHPICLKKWEYVLCMDCTCQGMALNWLQRYNEN